MVLVLRDVSRRIRTRRDVSGLILARGDVSVKVLSISENEDDGTGSCLV